MASVVDICNMAVSRLGDDATITSIDPPEGSMQAEYCLRFWPIARDSLLESHPWSFATRRATLAELTAETDAWAYAYALPANCLRVLAVQHVDATADYGIDAGQFQDAVTAAYYTPQPFAVESLSTGAVAILTNQEEAAARYIVKVTDPTKYSPLFVETASWQLASYLAGPMIKGDAGAKMAQYCSGMAEAMKARAIAADSSQRAGRPAHRVSWIAAR